MKHTHIMGHPLTHSLTHSPTHFTPTTPLQHTQPLTHSFSARAKLTVVGRDGGGGEGKEREGREGGDSCMIERR